ncbi:hypothetical protein [Halarchaeum nitratireducens]|uniref:Uncharacterized protein n=1 Tax=Halarchaeum nitratireducens TaxID=489913 RepID=A0A830GF83_9EURY|nr:hypothetical protein [Halarchaeum nitratireducens]GGN22200.1 hypothetical protein GCM10009021_24590 [Halarchaeum nitratireducens]
MFPAFPLITTLGTILLLIVFIAVSVWVALDARARGNPHPLFWAVFAPLSGVLLLYYVGWWRRKHDRERSPSRREQYAAVVAVAGVGGFLVSAVVLPPDPVSQMLFWPVAFVACLPVAYWLIVRRHITP